MEIMSFARRSGAQAAHGPRRAKPSWLLPIFGGSILGGYAKMADLDKAAAVASKAQSFNKRG
jgi:hypothetical protein